MIPQESLSPTLIYSDFLYPGNLEVDGTFDYELGGIALSDPSQGLQVQAWKVEIVQLPDLSGNAVISSSTQSPLVLFNLPSFTEISLAFDQDMKPFVAYVSLGAAGFWWYDATFPGVRFTALPSGARSPRCTLDDHRPEEVASGRTDIIVTYLIGNDLYFVAERDRYATPYLLRSNLQNQISNPYVNKVCMDMKYRLQWEIRGQLYQ